MKKILLLILVFQVLIFKPQNSFAQTTAVTDTVLSFVLSNEAPGYLIDNLVANGYGDSCLYSVLVALQPLSGGVITDAFLDTLAAFPAGSEIFTTHLANYTGFNNPVCINTDGTIRVNGIYGKEYFQQQGYQTYNDTLVPVGLKLFTYAQGPQYYIDAGSSSISGGKRTYYKTFAIAWSLGSTFVLSNEGGLVDDLIHAGHGNKNLYQTLEVLKPNSGGVISDEFMAVLAKCPVGSAIFTEALSNFSVNYPVCINSDGTISIQPIYGKDYFRKDGYTTLPLNQVGFTSELFTVANSAENYINAGQTGEGTPTTYYKAFAIAWKAATTFVLSNEGGLIDDLIRAGHANKNLYQTLEVLKPNSGGVISDEFMAVLANCPAGSEIFTATLSFFGGLNNPISVNTDGTLSIIPIFARTYQKEGYTTLPLNQGGYTSELFTLANSAENYIDAGSSGTSGGKAIIYYNAFAIAWKASTTFVLTNEGGLIDDLIRAGHGNKNLYQTLEVLKPNSGGVISDAFMATLANCSVGSEVYTTQLKNYTGFNNPVCINDDGTVNILGIFGADYFEHQGFSTYHDTLIPVGVQIFTYANKPEYYIEAGFSAEGEVTKFYKAFAIAWSDPTVDIPESEKSHILPFVYPNPFSEGFNIHNLPEQTRIEIFDLRGKLMYQTEPKANSLVQPGFLRQGIYILKLINNQGNWQQKIVKY